LELNCLESSIAAAIPARGVIGEVEFSTNCSAACRMCSSPRGACS